MTISERLSNKLNGCVSDVAGLLIDRGLNPGEEYTADAGGTADFQLAYASGLVQMLMQPNLSEGDWSQSWGDRDALQKIAVSLFNRYAPDENPWSAKIINASDRW
jgi:hypothetical protein